MSGRQFEIKGAKRKGQSIMAGLLDEIMLFWGRREDFEKL
jgi:hypothetical protein